MNNLKSLFVAFTLVAAIAVNAQEPKTVSLSQTPGEFEQTELKLKAGKPYVFEVVNNGVDHEIGFVIAPKGKTDQANHISNAYLKSTISDGETAQSNEVVLEKGEYVYFCPLNPTPQYTLIVK